MIRLALLALLLVGAAAASPGLSYGRPSEIAPHLLHGADAPVRLEALSANVTIGPGGTSARGSVASGAAARTTDLASAVGTLASPQQVRLVLVDAQGAAAACASCTLQLACGATTSEQIVLDDGTPTLAEGPWLVLDAVGGACDAWTLRASVRAAEGAGGELRLDYQLELAHGDHRSPRASYTGMSLVVVA